MTSWISFEEQDVIEMDKKVAVLFGGVFVIIAALLFSCFIRQNAYKKDLRAVDEFQDIYNYLLDKEFYTAKLENSTLILKDKDMNVLAEYNLPNKLKSKLISIENRNTSMIFWTSGFDDLEGIMFMKTEWSDETWNGLGRVHRLRGNAYKVYTFN